jgi:dTDP-glucose 4,6-dehydratase
MNDRPDRARRVLVTGGAGFVGSHLVDALVARGDTVTGVADLATGSAPHRAGARAPGRCHLVVTDLSGWCPPAEVAARPGLEGPFDAVAHLASPASPPAYLRRPLETLGVNSRGTEVALEIARRDAARFLLASTSEVYGDPLVHPQTETYLGNVSPIGPRSVYDEAKRYAEALTSAYARELGQRCGIVRIFNTYGPRLAPGDGRVVSNFVAQALSGQPLTVYGDGRQTRSFCYVADLVAGLVAMLDAEEPGPVNLGNPIERTVGELAILVKELTGSTAPIEYRPLPVDDPTRRRPDSRRAAERLGWRPQVSLEEGLRHTIAWFAESGVLGVTS